MRFGQVFLGQRAHRRGIHVRRVADDQIIFLCRQVGVQVRFDQGDAVLQFIRVDVALGDGQRVGGNVHRIDAGVGEGVGHHDGQATRAGAQFQDVFHRFRFRHPWRKVFRDQLGDEGAGHDHALVDIEIVGAQPAFLGDVGGRHAVDAAAVDDRHDAGDFRRQQLGVEERFELVERQLQGVQDQIGRFVERFGAAVAEKQLGGIETGNGVAQQVAWRGKRVRGHGILEKTVFWPAVTGLGILVQTGSKCSSVRR